jgi:hypothetical protein
MLGTAATVGIAASASASTNGALGILLPARPRLSIGFADLTEGAPQRLRRADDLRSGDARFVSGDAHVTVHGLWRPESRRGVPANVNVSVFHAVDATTVPYLAWQHSRTSGSPRVTFRTPVHADGTLPIGIEHARPFSILAEPARRFGTMLRSGSESPVPVQETLAGSGALCSLAARRSDGLKLRRGTYFVALLDGQSQPNWNAITAGTDLNVRSEAVLRVGNTPVDFDYLVISIDRI